MISLTKGVDDISDTMLNGSKNPDNNDDDHQLFDDSCLKVKIYMSCRYFILTIMGQPRLLARFSAFSGQNPNCLLAFASFAAGIMLLISLMEMLRRISSRRTSPVLGYGMFIRSEPLFWSDRMLPHAHPQDLMQNRCSRCQNRLSAQPFVTRHQSA